MRRREFIAGLGGATVWPLNCALVSLEWIVVPDETIQYRALEGDTGETAGGHWCSSTRLRTIMTFCAVLPPSSASSIKAESNPKQQSHPHSRLPTR